MLVLGSAHFITLFGNGGNMAEISTNTASDGQRATRVQEACPRLRALPKRIHGSKENLIYEGFLGMFCVIMFVDNAVQKRL